MTDRVDDYNRGDSSTSLGAPSDGGGGYTTNGTWGIVSSRAYCVVSAAQSVAYLDASITDADVQVTLATMSADVGLVARVVDSNNYFLSAVTSGTGFRLYKRVAGSFTQLGTTYSGTPANGDVLKLTVNGTSLTVYVNGTSRITATDSSHASATKFGLRAHNDSSSRFDDFSVTGLGGGISLVLPDAAHSHSSDSLLLTTASTLSIADALHGHSADSLPLSSGSMLSVSDAAHAHTADALVLTAQSALSVSDATHGHSAEVLVLAVAGATTLTIADATHAHTVDGLTLTAASVLAIQEALHAHAADVITLTAGGASLLVADGLHAHTSDGLAITVDAWLAVADAMHGHDAANIVLTTPSSAAAADVWNYVLSNGKTAGETAVETHAMLTAITAALADCPGNLLLVLKLLRNKQITNPNTGTMTVYDDDGSTVLLQGNLFEDAAGSTGYRGQGAERRERLA